MQKLKWYLYYIALCDFGDCVLEFGKRSTTVFATKNRRGRMPPSCCEYSGVTYDLLVSDIGGTSDLSDKLSSGCHFGLKPSGGVQLTNAQCRIMI